MAEHRKRFLLLLTYTLIALPLIVYGALQALRVNANSPIDWVPHDFPARKTYDAFRETFGSGDLVVMSWEGCTVDNARIDALLTELRTAPVFFDESGQWYFEQVASGRELLAAMTSVGTGTPPQLALRRMQGTMVGGDGRTTCVVVTFTTAGVAKRSLLVPAIQQTARRTCDVNEADQHLAGPVIDGLSVDHASQSSLETIAPLSSLVILVVAWVCLESVEAAIVVFALSTLCQGVVLAAIHYCGDTMSALLIVMPPLIQVLAVAGGIHLVNYYFDAAANGHPTDAVAHAFRVGWLPCVLSAGTTAVGFASLIISELVPVRQFGAYAGAGVVVTMFVLLSFIPGMLLLRRVRLPKRLRNAAADQESLPDGGGWNGLTRILSRWHAVVSLIAIVAMGLLAYGVPRINTSVTIETLFPPQSRILKDYAWIEEHVGALVPIEVLVRFAQDCELSFPERLQIVNQLNEELSHIDGVTGTLSAVDWLPPTLLSASPPSPGLQPAAPRQWQQAEARLDAAHYLSNTDDGDQHWRITARISALSRTDYTSFLELVDERLRPFLRDDQERPLTGVSMLPTGIMPLVHQIQRQLLYDLFASFVTAFAVIAVVMTVVQAGVLAGLVSMVSNVFPTLLLFGGLGWLSAPIDIGSVMTASVALGIAVDDTLHFLTFFRRGLERYGKAELAVAYAYRHCGTAMVQTTVTCTAGVLLFAASDFVPTSRFAWMMVALMAAALFGDLIVLPALLLGPAGRLFGVPRRHEIMPVSAGKAEPTSQPRPQRTDRPEHVGAIPAPLASPSIDLSRKNVAPNSS